MFIVLILQKYKFWKQFTTPSDFGELLDELFWFCKNTNFESNSQLIVKILIHLVNCFDSAKIQILKAIHNNAITAVDTSNCFDSAKIQILKAIHNYTKTTTQTNKIVLILQKYKFWKQFTTYRAQDKQEHKLFWFCKNTNFESNSQQW